MKSVVREHLFEAVVGLLVVLLAVWFVSFAWRETGGGMRDSIAVKAIFPAANGISPGTDVRVAGLKVGSVAAQSLDPKSYQAEVVLALDRNVRIPSDSSAAITTESLLGGSYVALLPGGSETPLKDGDTILETQGSVDMMGLIGSIVNRGGGESEARKSAEPGLGTMEETSAR